MKKVFVLMSSFLVLALFFAACSDIARITTPDNTQQDITSFMKGSENAPDSLVPLYADQDWQVGNVSVWHTSDSLCVKYELYPSVTSDGWGITETHLAIYDSESEIPQTKKGNPIPGQFPYGDEDLPGVSSSPVYCFSFSDLDVECGDTLAMAAHAIIEKEVCEMVDAQLVCTIYKETAWRAGIPFVDKGNWATYFNYEIQPYTVSLSIDPDGAGTTSGAGDYCAGDEVTIEATAIGETTFLNWTDDDDGDAVVSAANPYTFTMPASDVNYTANFAVGVGCYTIPFTENFDGVDDYDLPPEWSQECIPDPDNPYESSTWYVYDLPAPIAGSLSEMIFIYSPTDIGTFRLISKCIDATGKYDLELSFNHMLDDWEVTDNIYTLKVQASLDGINWVDTDWSVTTTNSISAETVYVDLSAYDDTTFYLAWVFVGNNNDIDYWVIDDISVWLD